MDAIELLTSQHRSVERLFVAIDAAHNAGERRRLFKRLADSLAIHSAIEEDQLYPSLEAKNSEELLLESLEVHLAIKRALAEALASDAEDERFHDKLTALKEVVRQHVEKEEAVLFPRIKQAMDVQELQTLGRDMYLEQQIEMEARSQQRAARLWGARL